MSWFGGAKDPRFAVRAGFVLHDRFSIFFRSQKTFLLLAAVVGLLPLAACAPSPFANKNEFVAGVRQSPPPAERHASVVRRENVPKRSISIGTGTSPTNRDGIASFYTEDEETASGEKYDPNKLTAAHPTLPFGTRLRVTNLVNGHSVVVRVNDRGPFIPGRVVDVSYSAAETLGIVERGIVKVKLDVVH
jgi:rare lipoprotein A